MKLENTNSPSANDSFSKLPKPKSREESLAGIQNHFVKEKVDAIRKRCSGATPEPQCPQDEKESL